MKKIICEMCGGTDIVKQDGLFVCQSCGCKYSLEEARKMMVEVAGTVEVTGTVKVDNSSSVDTFLRMANNAIEAGNNKEAENYANRIIEIDPNNWQAWMLKGRSAGWQSTLQENRFSESVYAFGQAVSCAPEAEREEILTQAEDEIRRLSAALIRLRTSRFEQWPDDEESVGAAKDLTTILETIVKFTEKLGSSVDLSRTLSPLADQITDSVRTAWDDLIKPEFENDNDGHPDDYALEKMLDRAGNCITLMRTVMDVLDEDDEASIGRYDLMIGIHQYCISAKSYEKKVWTDYKETLLNGREYFTREQYVVSKNLNQNAIRLRNEDIENWSKKKQSIRKKAKSAHVDDASAAKREARNIRARICMRGKENTRLAACMNYSAAVREDGTVQATGGLAVEDWKNITALACGESHVVGLRSDGTVVAEGKNYNGQLEVFPWVNVAAIACGENHTAAVTSDGRVFATKSTNRLFNNGQSNVQNWMAVKAIACGVYHTVGLRVDGIVLATPITKRDNDKGQSRVEGWRDVKAIACGRVHTIGLRTDGTVLAAGYNYQGQCNVQGWDNIIQIACGDFFTAGLRANGTVVVAGDNSEGQCNTGDWENIVAIVCGSRHIVGLRMDGTVVAAGRNDRGQCNVQDWSDIMALACGDNHTIALREDGTLESTRLTGDISGVDFGQSGVHGWELFSDPEKHWEKLIADTEAARAAAEEQERAMRAAAAEQEKAWRAGRNEWLRSEQVRLTNRRAQLLAELPTLTGMLKAGRKAAVEQEIQQINIGLSQIAAELNANPTV